MRRQDAGTAIYVRRAEARGTRLALTIVSAFLCFACTDRADAQPCGHPTQDQDYDGDVDHTDARRFVACMTGPQVSAEMACSCLDDDTDSDVDLLDFARFQNVFAWSLCQLANPSFEHAGQRGNAFAGWYQLGTVSDSSDMVSHGHVAAKVRGPSSVNWDVSGVWQRLAAGPGDRWSASVRVGHRSTNRLSAETRAILNVEWHADDGTLIDYDSYTIADAGTPVDTMVPVSIDVGPAPAGTQAMHLLLGVLQSPEVAPSEVFLDSVGFSPPDLLERQWEDFPGGRCIDFSGRRWRVKGPGYYGPGPNNYSDCDRHVWVDWVDGNDRLHLTVRRDEEDAGLWYSTEITADDPLGYGDYVITTVGRLDAWDPNVVFGMFLWEYSVCYDPATFWWNPNNEIDIEFSRFGEPQNDVGQFAVKPDDFPGHKSRFPATFREGELTSHAFRWLPDRVEFRSWRGGPDDEASDTLIHAWTYAGPDVPRAEHPRVHINFWHLGDWPWSGTDHYILIDEFRFLPAP